MIEHRRQTGLFTGDVDDYCRKIIEDLRTGQNTAFYVPAADGCVVFVQNLPLPSGGFVSTHEGREAAIRNPYAAANLIHSDTVALQLEVRLRSMDSGFALRAPRNDRSYAWLAAVLPKAACAAASRAIGTRKGEQET